jgi:hypothetical protein
MRKLENLPLHHHISPVTSDCRNNVTDPNTNFRTGLFNNSFDRRIEPTDSCLLTAMPQDLIFHIVSYVGPSSPALINLAQVNKMFHRTLSVIADSIIETSKQYFRIPLPKLHRQESKLSHSIRHYRSFIDIENKCNELRKLIEKDFVVDCCLGPVIIRPMSNRCPGSTATRRTYQNTGERISMGEIDYALDIAMELIGLDSLSFFLAKGRIKISDIDKELVTSSSRLSILRHFSKDVENKVFSLVGQCGGKVYKYLRMQQIILKLWYVNNEIDQVRDASVFDRLDGDLMIRAKTLMRLVIFRENEFVVDDDKCILVRVNTI